MRTRLSSLSLLLALMACGGGADSPPPAVQELAARMHAADRASASPNRHPLALSAVGAKELFDWAEYKYPDLFPRGPSNFSLVHEGVVYTVRAYGNGNFLGLTEDGLIYGLGPFTADVLRGFGRLSDYVAQVNADSCAVYPGSCNNPGPLGPLNECMPAASEALALGRRLSLVYSYLGTGLDSGSGDMTVDSIVDQHTSFESQSAVRQSSTTVLSITGSGQTTTGTIRSKNYFQAAADGLILNLGGESELETRSPQGQFGSSTRSVYTPPLLNSEFTLAVGQSITRTSTAQVNSTTISAGIPLPPNNSTDVSTETYVFEARESLSLAGRSFDTCRYRESNAADPNTITTTWFIVGKGIPVRSHTAGPTSTETLELKSGTLNGLPL